MATIKFTTMEQAKKKFSELAEAFAEDLAKPIIPNDAQHSRMIRRLTLRQDFVSAYIAMKEIQEERVEL